MYRQGKESIQVTIRIRPLCDREREATEDQNHPFCIQEEQRHCLNSQRLALSNGVDSKSFAFDQIIGAEEDQQAVFERVGKGSIIKCLEGYNCSIFAYGQTGAGKTFTMMGVGHESPNAYQRRGLIPRTLEYLFSSVEREMAEEKTEYLIICRFLEIYNETIIDLLDKNNKNLQIREDLKKGVYVEGLSEATVTRAEEALELLRKGSKGRHVGSTFYNDTSSRSHSVYTLEIQSKLTKNSVTNVKQRSFHFIDLAGSERTKLLQDERLKEGCSINKSLHMLGMVINSLVESTEGKAKHVGYRDSKLTFLLKDSLGGNSKTHLIANISPSIGSYNQTLSTLSFAKRVKLIKVDKASINQDTTGSLQTLKLEIVRLKQELMEVKSNNVGSHLVSLQSMDADSSQITQLALQNESQIELEKLFREYIDDAILKETKMEVEVLRCLERLKQVQQLIKAEERGDTLTHPIYQNQTVLSDTLKYNLDFLKRLSKLLSSTITDRESITHILQTHPNNTYTLPYSDSPQPQPQLDYLEKHQQLTLEIEMLKSIIEENEVVIRGYGESQQREKTRVEEIVLDHTKVLEEIRERCGGQLSEMERYQEEMEGNINRMTLELLELKQELIVKEDELAESKSKNKVLGEQLLESNSRLQSSSTTQHQTTQKLNQLKGILRTRENELESTRRELEEAVSIVNKVQIQFQQQKRNNSERYRQVIKTNQETIWELEKQVNKYKLEQQTAEKERELFLKRNQEFYSDSLRRETVIAELREQLDDVAHRLELERNINKNQLNSSRTSQQQSMESRYEQLLNDKRHQMSALEAENQELKIEYSGVSNELKLKINVETILNSRLQSLVVRNREIEEELYRLKEKVLEGEEREIRQNREVESLKRKEGGILEQLNVALREKSVLEESSKRWEVRGESADEEIKGLKQRLERRESQLERVKSQNVKEVNAMREEFQQFRRRSHTNQQYFKQLFEQSNGSKEKILNDTKKHLLSSESELSALKSTLATKLREIKELQSQNKASEGEMKQREQVIVERQSEIDQLKEQLRVQESRFIIKIEERQVSFNQFSERKAQEIEELQERITELMQVVEEQGQERVSVLEEYEIMKQNHQQLLDDYEMDIQEKEREISQKQEMIRGLCGEMGGKDKRVEQLEAEIQGLGSMMAHSEIADQSSIHIQNQQRIQSLQKKLFQAQKIISSLDSDNHQLITQINNTSEQRRSTTEELGNLMRQKQLVSSDLNDKLQEIEQMKRRWEVKRKQELEGIEGQFREYREETQKINAKLMRNYEVLKEEQEKYKELVERYEEAMEWNQSLVKENRGLREDQGEQRGERRGEGQDKLVVLETIEEQDSRQGNRTQDITHTNQGIHSSEQSISESENIVNATQHEQQEEEWDGEEGEETTQGQQQNRQRQQQHQCVVEQLSRLQQSYQQLQEEYLRQSQKWQEQRESLINTIDSIKSQYQSELQEQDQHYYSKPRSTTCSLYPNRKPRASVNYQEEITVRLQLQKRGCQLQQITGGVLEICQLLNIKGLTHANTRFRIQTIKSLIQNMSMEISGYKREMREKEKEIQMGNVRAQIKEREFNRVRGQIKVEMVEGKGKSLRGVEEMRNQRSILQELHKRMKGQENRNTTNRM